jgi:cytoskeletal protein RodZ
MKTIGELVKDTRAKKRYSLAKVEDATKIKREFIEAIEKQNWKVLPDYPVVAGFVKNIAQYLGINRNQAVALLRRDYPPQKLSINPKPDVSKEFIWSPRLTFLVGVATIVILVLGYLGFQYSKFIGPPALEVIEPKEGQVVESRSIKVSGKTDSDAVVKANNQPILVNDEGAFVAEVQIFEGTTEIVIKATSRSGKETTIRRMIKPEFK